MGFPVRNWAISLENVLQLCSKRWYLSGLLCECVWVGGCVGCVCVGMCVGGEGVCVGMWVGMCVGMCVGGEGGREKVSSAKCPWYKPHSQFLDWE